MGNEEKINILLVDDRPDGLMTLEAVLSNPRYNLVKASSGREALSQLLDHEFAVIILDVQMPEMDGFETASLIKQREKSKYIPIIFVTAINKDPYFICKGYEIGAVDYLFKPFDPQILKSKVEVFTELYRKTKLLLEQTALLKNSEESKRLLIESARDIIATTSEEGVITSLSPAFETITGWQTTDWIGRHFDNLVEPDDLPIAMKYFTDILQGRPVLFETRLVGKSGNRIPIEASAKPLIKNGVIQGAIAIVRDITERKEVEKEKKIRFELERSNTELEQFAHICSHDLQEPLRTMSSFAFLLKEKFGDSLDQEASEMIKGLLDGASRMSFLISDLLEYAHVGAAEIPLSEIEPLLSLEIAIQNLKTIIEESDAKITFGELPSVMANHLLLVQVFQNLVSNSIKFKSLYPPHIHISSEIKNGECIFSIKDNGIGFKMEYCDKIFQVFKRLHHSEHYPGTGIGLGICKRIIERQGGKIWAESIVGKGSTFYFTLQNPSSFGKVLRLPQAKV